MKRLLVLAAAMLVLTPAPARAESAPIADRIVTVPGPGRPVVVRVLHGDGSIAAPEFLAYGAGFRGGAFVATANYDPASGADIVTGPDRGGGPHVRVFRFNGELRSEFMAFDPGFLGGVRVASADIDGDGQWEIVAGAGPGGGPHVRVLKGNGAPLAEFMAFDPAFTGGVFVAGGNLDDDPASEVVVGAGQGGGAHVRVFDFSCAAGSCVAVPKGTGFFAYGSGFRGGARVAVGLLTGGHGIVTGAGPGGGPHIRGFGEYEPANLREGYVFDPGFAGGVFVGTNYGRAGWFVVGAGEGGGPHVRIFDFYGTNPDPPGFYAYEPGFRGGVRVAIGVAASR